MPMTPEQQDEYDERVRKGDKDDSTRERIQRAKDAFRKPNTTKQKLGDLKADRMTEMARRRYRGNKPSGE